MYSLKFEKYKYLLYICTWLHQVGSVKGGHSSCDMYFVWFPFDIQTCNFMVFKKGKFSWNFENKPESGGQFVGKDLLVLQTTFDPKAAFKLDIISCIFPLSVLAGFWSFYGSLSVKLVSVFWNIFHLCHNFCFRGWRSISIKMGKPFWGIWDSTYIRMACNYPT